MRIRVVGLPAVLCSAAWLAAVGARARAEITLAPIFGAGAILQRDAPLTIWGTAQDAERISVTLNGHHVTTVASNGKWHAVFPAMKAAGPVTLEVAGSNTIVRHELWIGEVFLCTGGRLVSAPLPTGSTPGTLDQAPPVRVLYAGSNAGQAGWQEARSAMPSAAMFAFAQALRQSTHTAVGLVVAVDRSAPISSWIAPGSEPGSPAAVTTATAAGPAFSKLIAPLAPYSFGAVILAPGVADLAEASAWRARAGWLISGWRKLWSQPLPFVLVQAPGHTGPGSMGGWPELREAELGASTTTAGVALVVTADLAPDDASGDKNPSTIIGQRLAATVQMFGSGFTGGPTGPRPIGMQREMNQFLVTFDHVGKGLIAPGGELDGFEVQDKGGLWHPAEAFIRRGNTAIVFCEGVDPPAAVRYGWADAPQMNLANSDGAPVSPFRLTP
ncbi:MAG: hypothetical protein KGJ62_00910 [Armatimonadetes bacterium]|nr:hypothetical protein [Armatimonadota bacterium]MDE2205097.1 hypothetical protein [Armatimonadota bacterium]